MERRKEVDDQEKNKGELNPRIKSKNKFLNFGG
jgi:hypothetical protein